MTGNKTTPHKLTKFARVEGIRIVYPKQAEGEAPLFATDAPPDAAPD
jgi:hypothetical protein